MSFSSRRSIVEKKCFFLRLQKFSVGPVFRQRQCESIVCCGNGRTFQRSGKLFAPLARLDRLVFALELLDFLQLMSKLRDQYAINDRLRDYIERMLSVIIEHNPQLLEVTTSSGLSIGSMMSGPTRPAPKSKDSPNKYCPV